MFLKIRPQGANLVNHLRHVHNLSKGPRTMTRRQPPKSSPCCNRPMTRIYAKVKPHGGGSATMKATGWMCPKHRHTELDKETPFEKAIK